MCFIVGYGSRQGVPSLPPFYNVHTTIRMTVVSVFVLATLLTAAMAIGLQYYFSQSIAREAAADLYTSAAQGIASELRGIGNTNGNIINLLADNPALADADKNEAEMLEIFTQVLARNPLFYGIYVGTGDDRFFEVINLDTSEEARRRLLAVPADKWLVVSIRDGLRHFAYLDASLQTRTRRSETSDFAPSTRAWYTTALASNQVEVTDPYLFAHLGIPGRTVSRRVRDTDVVVGIDLTMTSMSAFLASHEVADDSTIYLYNGEGLVLASSKYGTYSRKRIPAPKLRFSHEERAYLDGLPALKVSNELNWPPFDYTESGEPRGYSIDVMNLVADMLGIRLEFVNGLDWQHLVAAFQRGELDVLHSVALTDENRAWGLHGKPYVEIPFALLTRAGEPAIKALSDLGDRTLAIPRGWSIMQVVKANNPDIRLVEVEDTLDAIERVAAGEVYAALDNRVILEYISRHYFIEGTVIHGNVDLGTTGVPDQLHILVSDQRPELRRLVDRAIAAIGPEHRAMLTETWLDFDSLAAAATTEIVPTEAMLEATRGPARREQLFTATVDGEKQLVYVSPQGENQIYVGILTPVQVVMAPFLEQVRLSIAITAGLLLALLPLSWLFANPIVRPVRQLADENDKVRRREFDAVQRVPSRVKEIDELSDSMVSMVQAIQAYEEAQRALMDSFIQLIAQAIDDKSAYTGGHCERVPELALMLARHASDTDHPAFEDFRLESDEQWREYRIAAWLHDCGKITTPEHIVDKGSKLETIYNRIHEVRMRFEVLWRDAEIDYLHALAERPAEQAALARQLADTRRQLQEDFTFVAECNVGGEFMDEAHLDRLHAIARRSWTRFFDARVGLSPVEELRLKGDKVPVPATEPLLADREEHIIERDRSTDYDPRLGIKMDIPEHLYNQGEIYNLSISRGTLTAEDRFKINEHMISTIRMLESLPFPEELKNVPRYASTHHETMKGTGYPRKLPGEKLSIPERILAVADVFEALTAADRPYKKAKSISVAVDILHKMVEDNHIDRDCFELFLREGVYLEYARNYLAADQIDDVDISRYLN